MSPILDRRIPSDFTHVEKHPITATRLATPPANVEKILRLPSWHWTHDQGSEGACVGHGTAMERAITNTAQGILAKIIRPTTYRRYDPIWIWNQAKIWDEWPDTNPGDSNGTSVRAAYDIMRTQGPVRCKSVTTGSDGIPRPIGADPAPTYSDGAQVNVWATTVDDMRSSLAAGIPVTIGVNWYENFDTPVKVGGDYWLGQGPLGAMRGGHCTCIYGASDRRQAFRLKNSWGKSYPLVWLPYTTMAQLLTELGEATLVVDR